jgi:hypothetical protein
MSDSSIRISHKAFRNENPGIRVIPYIEPTLFKSISASYMDFIFKQLKLGNISIQVNLSFCDNTLKILLKAIAGTEKDNTVKI